MKQIGMHLDGVPKKLKMAVIGLFCITVLTAMEDQEAQLGIHEPLAGVALVLDLIEGAQVPLAIALAAPEGVVVARISRLDPPGTVGAALRGNASVLHLDVLARSVVGARRTRRSRRRSGDGSSMAVRDVVGSCGCVGTGRIDHSSLSRHTIVGHRSVVRPLIRRVEVSERVHRAIKSVVVVAPKAPIASIATVTSIASKPAIGRVVWIVAWVEHIGIGGVAGMVAWVVACAMVGGYLLALLGVG